MAQKVLLEVIVSDGGSAKIIQKGIEGVGAAAERTTKKTKEAGKAQDELNYKLNQGTIGSSSAARSFSKLNQAIGAGPNGLVGAYATLAANAFAVSAAFNALKNAATVTQLMQGLDAQGARMGRTLSLTAKNIQEITDGALGMADAMRATAQATASGFNTQEIGRLAAVANNAAKAMGRDLTDSLDRVIKGVGKLEPELLDELGIVTKLGDASAAYATKVGKSANALSAYEKKQAFLNAVLAEGELKFGGLSESIDTNIYEKLGASFDNLKQSTLEWINSLSPLLNLFAGQSALAGGILLFASAIKSQLLPGLIASSEASREAAEAHSQSVQKELSDLTKVTTGKRKETNAYIQALKEGTDTTQQYGKAIAEIQANREKLVGVADRQNVTEETLSKLTEKQTARLKKLSEQEDALTKAKGARSKVAAELAQAEGIEAAESLSLFNIKEGLTGTVNSLTEIYKRNKEQVVGAQGATMKWSERLKVLGKTGAASLSVLGTAFLNIVPIIGQLLIAGQLLYEGFKWLEKKIRPQAYFDMIKAQGELDEIFARTNERAKEMQRLLQPNANLAEAQTKQFELMTNAIIENVDRLKEYQAAKEELEKGRTLGEAKDKTEALAKFNETVSEKELAAQREYNRNTVNLVAEGFRASAANGAVTETLEQAGQAALKNSEEFKTLENVYASSTPKMQKYVLNFVNTLDFSSDRVEYNKNRITTFVTRISDTIKSLGASAREVQNSFKVLGDATTKFTQSLKISTSFDELANAFNANSIAIRQLTVDLQAYDLLVTGTTGSYDTFIGKSEELGQALSGISAESRSWLSGASLLNLRDLEQANNRVVDLGKEYDRVASNEDVASKKQAEALRLQIKIQKDIVAEKSKAITTIQQELNDTRLLVLENQKQARIAAGRLKYEQARQSTISAIYEGTAAGEAARLSNEQKIRDLQITQLDLQRKLVKEQQRYNESQQQSQRDLVDAIVRRNNGLNETNQLLLQEQASLDKNSARYIEINDILRKNSDTIQENALQIRREIIALDQLKISASDIAQAMISINYERSAILVLNLSKAQTEAARLKVEMEEVSRYFETIAKRQQQIKDIKGLELAFKKLFGGGTFAGIIDEVQKITFEYDSQKQLLLDQLAIKLEQLGADKAGIATITTLGQLEKAAQDARLRTYDAQIQNEIILAQSESDRLQLQKELDILSKIWLDSRKEGLEIQMQALSSMEKEISNTNELRDATDKTLQLRKQLYRIRAGIGDSEAIQRADEIRAAETKYKNTLNEVNVKTALIDLEFALLKGQQELLKQQLSQRKELLMTQYGMTEDDPAIKQLTAALSSLEKAPDILDRAASASKRVLVEGVSQARTELEIAIEKSRAPSTDTFSSRIKTATYGRQEQEAARRSAEEALATGAGIEGALATSINRNTEIQQKVPDRIVQLQKSANANLDTKLAVMPNVYSVLVNIDSTLSKFFETTSFAEKLARQENKEQLQAVQSIYNRPVTGGRVTEQFRAPRPTGPHSGVDIGIGVGTPIRARFPGKLTSNMDPAGGLQAFVSGTTNLGQTMKDGFAHLSRVNTELLNTVVKQGDIIGWTGGQPGTFGAGRTTGPHLHWTFRINGDLVDPLKPYKLNVVTEQTPAAVTATQPAIAQPEVAYSVGYDEAEVSATAKRIPAIIQSILDETPLVLSFNSAAVDAGIAEVIMNTSQGVQEALNYLDIGEVFSKGIDIAKNSLDELSGRLRTLGPDGEVKAAVVEGFSEVISQVGSFADAIKAGGIDTEGVLNRVASMIGAVAGLLKATSDAKIAGIDKEIAAEQKRDGKSAESVTKMEALEKKKDATARKAFNTQKKLMMAQAVMSTAAGIAGALGSAPGIAGIILAGIIGAMGAAQVAIIAGTQYESSYAPKVPSMPSTLSIGKRSDTVNLAGGPSAYAGGEAGYLRGASGMGTNASNYRTVGSAYGGDLMRGYGNRGFVVGEKGPEVISPETPINVTPANENTGGAPVNATINIQAIDSQGVQDVLVAQKGNIIQMIRQAANASGQRFLEDVNVNVYTRPSVGKLL